MLILTDLKAYSRSLVQLVPPTPASNDLMVAQARQFGQFSRNKINSPRVHYSVQGESSNFRVMVKRLVTGLHHISSSAEAISGHGLHPQRCHPSPDFYR